MKDDDCGCGKQIKQNRERRQASLPHSHQVDPTTARGLKPDDLHSRIQARGFAQTATVKNRKHTVTVWKRPTASGALDYNDTLLTMEVDGEIKMFRLSEARPLGLILSGKAPPA